MLVIAWLGIVLPTFAGVQVESARDPVVREILASLCLSPGSTSNVDDSGEPERPSGFQCLFCFPTTNAAHGLLVPDAVPVPMPSRGQVRWEIAAVFCTASHTPLAANARGPPSAFS